jgi:hypothetical protein
MITQHMSGRRTEDLLGEIRTLKRSVVAHQEANAELREENILLQQQNLEWKRANLEVKRRYTELLSAYDDLTHDRAIEALRAEQR